MQYDTNLTRYENFQRTAAARVNVPEHVENEGAYIAHAAGRITANWVKGNRQRWYAAHADAQRISDWLFSDGEFAGTWDDRGNFKRHPLGRSAGRGGFADLIEKLAQDLRECGGLSDKQTEIVRNAMNRQGQFNAEREAKFAAARAQDAAVSQWIGTEGERRDFELDIQWVKAFEGIYGVSFIHGLKDLGGNVVVYKGTNKLGEKGERVMLKATIKAHSERDGVKQTQIARPKVK
jgi:hypothetical protein